MNLDVKKRIVEKIIKSEDEDLLDEICSLVGLSETDFWSELPRSLQADIKEAENQLKNNEGINHDQLMKEVKSRYLKR